MLNKEFIDLFCIFSTTGGGLGYFIFRGLQIVYIDGKTSPSTEGAGPTIEREAGYSGTYSANSDTDAMPTPAGAYLDT